ncbi:MAG: DNA gyrase modulator, partial [Candidatus Competibacter sp.]
MTTDSLALARQRLLVPAGLGEDDLQRTLSCLLGHAIDGGDLYFQLRRAESWALEDGQVKQASHAIQHGVGVRAVSGEKTGFAYSDEIVPTALLEAATAARAIARHGGAGQLQMWRSNGRTALYQPLDPLESLTAEAKIRLLEQVDAEARRQDPRVAQVMVSLAGTQDTILVAGSDGTLAGDVRPLARLNV